MACGGYDRARHGLLHLRRLPIGSPPRPTTAKATPQHAKHGNAASTTNLRAALPLTSATATRTNATPGLGPWHSRRLRMPTNSPNTSHADHPPSSPRPLPSHCAGQLPFFSCKPPPPELAPHVPIRRWLTPSSASVVDRAAGATAPIRRPLWKPSWTP